MRMTEPTDAVVGRSRRQTRKATIWSRDKIAHLIKLYRKNECLWNHFISSYKSKVKRSKAIDNICEELSISKFDFVKKIHNLRNQFNSEMKKLERRVEEMGGSATELNAGQRCRWEHFESLMFLRNVIEPRPAGYQAIVAGGGAPGSAFPQTKKMRLKYDYTSDDDSTTEHLAHDDTSVNGEQVTVYQFEEPTAGGVEEVDGTLAMDNFEDYDEVQVPATIERGELCDKYNPPTMPNSNATSTQEVTTTTNKTYHAKVQKALPSHLHQHSRQQEVVQLENATQHLPTDSVIELPLTTTTNLSRSASVEQSAHLDSSPRQSLRDSACASVVVRDQWDAFGELIASEFRNLDSDLSRKKLKRKIMQAMLEVGEEDDELSGTHH